MLEKALSGSRAYWGWIAILLSFIIVGFGFYLYQLNYGLGVTGMSRDVSWGLYIGQFTFLVGVAASAVMLVIPYYLHDYKKFGRIVILGEFLAVAAVLMCVLFIMVDMGQPMRVMNIFLHPTPNSIIFWDTVVLSIYALLNIVIGWTTLEAERKSLPPPTWVKPLIYISIPWAISIHTVTAFLYAGLPGRDYWLTAIMAARFLASAFSGGPAFLLLSALVIKRFTKFDPGREAIQTLSKIIAYAMVANVFFICLELFTSFYSNMPGHMHPFEYLYAGAEGHGKLAPLMWISNAAAALSLILLLVPPWRKKENLLVAACILVFVALWIDKGFGLVVGGFVPNPFGEVFEYWPTAPEVIITLGVWAIGLFVLTILHKVAVSVKESVQ